MAKIEVGTVVKALVEKHALAVCKLSSTKADSFTQDLNAIAIMRALIEIGALEGDIDGDVVTYTGKPELKPQILQVLKKGGNSSALRQAIMSDKKDGKVEQLVGDYAGMV